MNAQDIWAGHDYAHHPDKGRGRTFVPGARRIKVMRVFKAKPFSGAERFTSYADVLYLSKDGNPDDRYPDQRQVRCRDIISRWEEYAEEARQHAELHARQEREREETLLAREREKQAYINRLVSKGIPSDAIQHVTPYSITLKRKELLPWLMGTESSRQVRSAG